MHEEVPWMAAMSPRGANRAEPQERAGTPRGVRSMSKNPSHTTTAWNQNYSIRDSMSILDPSPWPNPAGRRRRRLRHAWKPPRGDGRGAIRRMAWEEIASCLITWRFDPRWWHRASSGPSILPLASMTGPLSQRQPGGASNSARKALTKSAAVHFDFDVIASFKRLTLKMLRIMAFHEVPLFSCRFRQGSLELLPRSVRVPI